jgi:hypothetical protein
VPARRVLTHEHALDRGRRGAAAELGEAEKARGGGAQHASSAPAHERIGAGS